MRVKKPAYPLNIIIMDILEKAVAVTQNTDGEALANDVRQKLVDKIHSNDFNFNIDPTSDYQKRKAKSGTEGAGSPLIDTGDYVESIIVTKIPNGYSIGVEDRYHKTARPGQKPIKMRDLARILEFGFSKYNVYSAPFPHWRPALANLRKRKAAASAEIKKQVAKRMQMALNDYLKQSQNMQTRKY